MPPFPTALCGKNPTLAGQSLKQMDEGGEFQVTTIYHSTHAATTELSALLSGQTVKPSSGLGSNASGDTSTAPKAIIVGAGFSEDEFETIRKGVQGSSNAEQLAWFKPAKTEVRRPGEAGFMEAVVGRAKEALRTKLRLDGSIEAGVHGF